MLIVTYISATVDTECTAVLDSADDNETRTESRSPHYGSSRSLSVLLHDVSFDTKGKFYLCTQKSF